MTAKEALIRALRHLEQHGWCKGSNGPFYIPCCAAQAINVVCMDHRIIDQATRHLAAAINPRSGRDATALIVAWNDSPRTTFDDVAAAFRRAIETAP